jgi:hypothetical protein
MSASNGVQQPEHLSKLESEFYFRPGNPTNVPPPISDAGTLAAKEDADRERQEANKAREEQAKAEAELARLKEEVEAKRSGDKANTDAGDREPTTRSAETAAQPTEEGSPCGAKREVAWYLEETGQFENAKQAWRDYRSCRASSPSKSANNGSSCVSYRQNAIQFEETGEFKKARLAWREYAACRGG